MGGTDFTQAGRLSLDGCADGVEEQMSALEMGADESVRRKRVARIGVMPLVGDDPYRGELAFAMS